MQPVDDPPGERVRINGKLCLVSLSCPCVSGWEKTVEQCLVNRDICFSLNFWLIGTSLDLLGSPQN
eukprot:6482992-Amphidinium_carterae.1